MHERKKHPPFLDWEEVAPAPARGRRTPRGGGRPRTRTVVLASAVAALLITPFGVAATGDVLREGVRNGTTNQETEIIGDLGATTTAKGGYVTRQSNLSDSGGGAIYGCRSKAGGTAATPPQNPCVRASNLSDGHAFEFNSSNGDIVGAITAGAGGDTKRPFTTNATGVATGLNSDRLDGLHASEVVASARTKAGLAAETADTAADANTLDGLDSSAFARKNDIMWAFVSSAGALIRSSGGVTSSQVGTGRYIVSFPRDITTCSYTATSAAPDNIGVNPQETGVNENSGTTDTVAVRTEDSAGTDVDDEFMLQVLC